MIHQSKTELAHRVAFIVAAAAALLMSVRLGYGFFGAESMDLVGSRPIDGFAGQLTYVENAYFNGGLQRLLLTDGLLVIHTLRYVVAWPFVTLQDVGGGSAVLCLLLALIYPLSRFRLQPAQGPLDLGVIVLGRSLPVLAAALVSGRTTLVAIGAGYMIAALVAERKAWRFGLFLAIPLLSLSSSIVALSLAAAAAMFLFPTEAKRNRPVMVVSVALLALLLLPSFVAKLRGFTSATDGYVSTTEALADDNSFDQIYGEPAIDVPDLPITKEQALLNEPPASDPFAVVTRVLSRSTLYVSYAYRQTSRLTVYLGMIGGALCYLAYCAATRRRTQMLVPVAVLAFGGLLEGLGLWALLWPLVWALAGPDRPTTYLIGQRTTKPNERAFVEAIGKN